MIALVPQGTADPPGASAWPSSPLADALLAADPLEVPALVRAALDPLGGAPASEVHRHLADLQGRAIDTSPVPRIAPPFVDDIPHDLRAPVVTLWSGKVAGEAHLERAFAVLSRDERAALPTMLDAAEEARRDVAMGTATPGQLRAFETFLTAAARIDQDALATAGFVVTRAVEEALVELAQVDLGAARPDVVSTCASGSVVYASSSCLVVIGGSAATTYTSNAGISLDLGGTDRYENNAGGSRVLLHTVSMALDLGVSDDVYDAPAPTNGGIQGAANLGVGVLVDEGGHDTYTARFASTSASARTWAQGTGVFGFGLLWDQGGSDTYFARNIAQGAGLQGFGYLLDDAGSDTYTIPYSFDSEGGQGTGCYHNVGALVDRGAGSDVYDAFIDDMQGFGCAAAVGVLYDGGGPDQYVLRDGVGDLGGNTLVQSGWGQGYGELGAAAFLYDAGGDDVYLVTGTSANSGQQVQGVGVVGGVGVLVDEAGNDQYIARTSVQGAALLGALGILVDGAGNDAYTALEGCQGYGLAGVGVLVDLGGGTDTYDCPESVLIGSRGDGRFWSAGLAGGLGFDR